MKLTITLLPLAALTTAFVIPDEQAANQLAFEENNPSSFLDNVKARIHGAVQLSENALDTALNYGIKAAQSIESYESMTRFETQEWLNSAISTIQDFEIPLDDKPHPPPHHPPPHHPPHHDPHHDPHHKPNKTVYELIAGSKYTTKLAKLIGEYPDLVKTLNGTKANFTVFAPTDKAFEKIPEHHKPSKEIIEKILSYHVSPEFYPAGRILVSHTIPTAYKATSLGGHPQRLRVGLGLRGLAVNFYSRVIAINIFGTNGVIHAVDTILLPPPEALKILGDLPSEFSTLELALIKTGLGKDIEKANHQGGTFFAPSNGAFQKLGPRINHFLFSERGVKYLKALLEYHVVANQTLYSDAFYKPDHTKEMTSNENLHYDLPTLLKDKNLSIDIASWGAFVTIKINGFSTVSVADGIAADGVIQVVSNVLIPPKSPGDTGKAVNEDVNLEEFKQRLIPYNQPQEL